ncbi:hypothetical protein SAMN02745111_01172 [Eubacterium uniforme]|uniref:Uncharacterized protein n=1 Tax=Eubacterium uniforme TaxID=39495 RepID=A0A1T4VL93_9FIRM|nr:hypothetical protein [Eubacterium uniforme]SKA65706.1 hypothetical protein SAMN02745111_01172 [Eubacterium uniforme]
MDYDKRKWIEAKEKLIKEIIALGFPEELGDALAKNLGSPQVMYRMTVYLQNVKPKKVEMVVDEMLAICSDIGRWKEKKVSEAANANYNEYLESKRYE